MLKTTSVICLSLSLILFSKIDPTLSEIELSLCQECLREMKLSEGKKITELDQLELGLLIAAMNLKYKNVRDLTRYLSCASNIEFYIRIFPIQFSQVPDRFHYWQLEINKNLNTTVYERMFQLGNHVKQFVTFYASTANQDKEKFNELWTKLKDFELYYPPEGKYDVIIPIKTPISEDLKNLLINLNTAKNSKKAWELWTQDEAAWGKIANKNLLSDSHNNTLLQLSLLSGKKLDDFITRNSLYGEHTYVIGMIEAGRSIRDKFVDKKYNHCFWTLYYEMDKKLSTLKQSLQKKWNRTLESQVVDMFCEKMVTLFHLVSDLDYHVDVKLIPDGCPPNSADYKAYVQKISMKDKDLVPVVEFILGR